MREKLNLQWYLRNNDTLNVSNAIKNSVLKLADYSINLFHGTTSLLSFVKQIRLNVTFFV